MPDLNSLSLEELAGLPDWMVPPSRKAELAEYKARKRRGAVPKTPEEEQQEAEAARRKAGLQADGSKPNWIGRAAGGSPVTKEGPRGGRYTEGVTRDGRPYRRYF
jgi:hypothetical protein